MFAVCRPIKRLSEHAGQLTVLATFVLTPKSMP